MSIKGFSVGGNVERYDYNALDNIPSEITIDTALSGSSTNPVQNKVVTGAINATTDSVTALSGEVSDLKSALLQSIDAKFMIKMTAIGEKIPFRAVAGNVINVKTSSGSNFTVTKLNLYTKNGTTLFDWYGLSSQGSAVRNITLATGADIYYAQLEGGTVQDIIVTNTSSYFNWKDEVDALTVKDNEFYYTFSRANNIVEVTELGKYIPFYAKAGHYVTVKSRDGSNLTPHDITYYTSAKVKIDDKWLNNVARKSLTFVAPSDIGYIQINGGTAQDVIVTNDSEYMPSTINKLVKLLETIPNYYETQMATKEAEIRGHEDDCGFVGDSLIFITDTHFASDLFTSNNPSSYFNANNSFSLIKHIINNTAVRMVCFGGDLVNSTTDIDTMLRCMSVFGSMFEDNKYRLRYCVGNHEYFTGNDYGQTTKPTPGELYGSCPKFNENNYLGKGEMCTYFFDNAVQKIRYFIVSCGRDTELTVNQVKWLLNEFTQVPSGYKVIVIGHAFLSDDLATFRGYHANICGALDAINAGTSYTFSSTTYDYSGLTDVEVVCVITGHTHIDGSIVTTGGIPCICTTTDSYDQNYELVDGTPTASPRTKGTTDEQAFDIYQFDFANRKIYVTRIGYGADREFSY